MRCLFRALAADERVRGNLLFCTLKDRQNSSYFAEITKKIESLVPSNLLNANLVARSLLVSTKDARPLG